jgi:ATP phosphoribosyltransferase
MNVQDDTLRIAIPSKGRLKDQSVDLLKRSGLKFRISGRQLFATCRDTGILIILSNAQDIPLLVAQQVVDLGITGSDLVLEKKADVTEHHKLGFGKCRLSIAVHKDSDYNGPADLAGKIVGTKFMTLAARYFEDQGVADVKLLEIQGAVEVMELLGLVDGIVEIVETGTSLREHDLLEREEVLSAEAVLIGNKAPRNEALASRILRRVSGVLIAARHSMLEYNCPADRIDDARRITPGYSAPTIQQTGDDAWLAVKVMVERGAVHKVMDELEAIGCQAIIETELRHCRL